MNTGGPAFPTGIITDDKGVIIGGSNGMTLRDYFAAKAMQACITSGRFHGYMDCASDSYKMADAMIVARGKSHD
jgi:hypothetical protein